MTEQQVNEIVEGFRAALRDGTADARSFPNAVDALQALAPVTELDRMRQLLGSVRLLDALLEAAPAEGMEEVRAQRQEIFALLMRQYGSDTPYVRSRTIVEDVSARLVAGEDSAQLMTEAMAKLEALDFEPADESARTAATLAVQALRAAHDWVLAYDARQDKGDPLPMTLRTMAMRVETGGFDREALVACAQSLREGRLSLDGTPNGHALALMVLVGLGLRANASALPGLDPAMALLFEALADAHAAESSFSARCDAVVAELDRRFQTDGFSEHVFNQAVAGLKELEPETDDDRQMLRSSLLRLLDVAAPHAPPEFAQTMTIARDAIEAQDAPPQPPLETAAAVAEANAIVQRLRDGLAGGALIAPAVTRALTELQALSGRIDESDEAAFRAVLQLMPEVVSIAAQYAPADKGVIAADVADAVRGLMTEADGAMGDDPVRREIAIQSSAREGRRIGQLSTNDPYEQSDASPLQRQFASLLRPLAQRMTALRALDRQHERDEAEAKRISNRLDAAVQRLRAATTDEQWIEHLRGSLRRVAVDLRHFERRHHLMVIEPPWSTGAMAVDPNAVFFSGEPAAHEAVDAACRLIGMDRPIAHGVQDPTSTRWNLLRRSSVAVFDFGGYDRAAADPPGELARSKEKRAAVVRAAAPTARVAYECGWAFVLGSPIVTLTRAGHGLPFDIDIEPVPLQQDGDDPMRIALALQAAVLGVQREARSEDLVPTIARLRELYGGDATAAALLASFERSRDGMHVQLGAAALLERDEPRRAMLTLPAFAPHYPRAGRPPMLFHVTAFRPWSKPCEESVRDACARAGLEYRIGYERLDPDILRAIWQDIAEASFVVADLTNLNPNAALELAMAQALGRPTLVISQTPEVPMHLPAVAKIRVHHYTGTPAGRKELSELVQRLAGAAALPGPASR